MRQVSVVIVNWNTGKLLSRCLAALCSVPDAHLVHHIIVVDNASDDESLTQAQEWLRNERSSVPVRFISQDKNIGFARATNIGIEASQGTHVLLLNPDTEILPRALERMLSALERNPRVAVVGPQLLNPDRSVQPSVRSFPALGAFLWLFLKLHRLFPRASFWRRYIHADFQYEREQFVDQVMGAAFLIGAPALAALGSFDNRFWLWFEEVDFCRRARTAGWSILYLPSAQVVHYGATSFNQLVGIQRVVPFLLSALHYARLHLRTLQWMLLVALFPLAVLFSFPAAVAHIRSRKKNKVRL